VVLEVNDTWVALCGFERTEVVGRSARSMWVEPEHARRFIDELRTKGRVRGWEESFRKKSGEVFVAELWTKVLNISGEEVILSTLMDITPRKRAQDALRESERRLREMLENVELIAMALDTTGTITFCNDFFLRITGWRREEVLGRNWFETFIPGDEATRRTFFETIEPGKIPAHYENPIQTRSGGLLEIVSGIPPAESSGPRASGRM
jgi:PAS domain S-box-containing protein